MERDGSGVSALLGLDGFVVRAQRLDEASGEWWLAVDPKDVERANRVQDGLALGAAPAEPPPMSDYDEAATLDDLRAERQPGGRVHLPLGGDRSPGQHSPSASSPKRFGAAMAELTYELSFKGAASDTLAAAFEDCDVTTDRGVTIVRSTVPDQAGLQGLIGRISALGLELIDVHAVTDPRDADSRSTSSEEHGEERRR